MNKKVAKRPKNAVEYSVKNPFTVEKFDNMLFKSKGKHQKNI